MKADAGEARQRAITSATMIALGVLAAFFMLQDRFFDPKDLMTYEKTDGPFAATVANDNAVALGPAITSLRRGGTFGWVTTLCLASEVAMTAQLRLVHIPDKRTILYQDRSYAPNTRVCGPRTQAQQVPPDAPLGRYELQRSLILLPGSGSPRSETLPPISLEVVP